MLPDLLLDSRDRRPRNRVARKRRVQVKQDPGVRVLVQRAARHASRQGRRPASRHLQIHALGVILRAVQTPRSVQRDDLVPQHVVSRLQRARDLDAPGVVVRGEIVRGPVAGDGGWGDNARGVDFREFEGCRGRGRAFAVTGGKIVNHGSLMRIWPGQRRPLQLDGIAGFDRDVELARGGGFMAGDVGG